MGEHPLDGKVRLAGIRRTEDGLHAGGETGVQAVHGQDVCAARRGMQGVSGARNRPSTIRSPPPLRSRRYRMSLGDGLCRITNISIKRALNRGRSMWRLPWNNVSPTTLS